MAKSTICYRVHKGVKPATVLGTLEELFKTHSVTFERVLFKVNVCITEFECDGKWHSNRERNAIATIMKRYPVPDPFYQYNKRLLEEDIVQETVSIQNFSNTTGTYNGEIAYSLIREIVKKIPVPYGVNDLELKFCNVRFNENGNGSTGQSIRYERSKYGNEQYAYLYFTGDDEHLDQIRTLFFAFAQVVSGKYEGTVPDVEYP